MDEKLDTNIQKNTNTALTADFSDSKTPIDLSVLDGLSDSEKDLALKILNELATKGSSDEYAKLILEDYAEIPVDILTFVDDYNYLGNAWHDNEGKSKLYPYWRKELLKLFPDNLTTNVNNTILSGSRGRGKSEIASLIMAYMLHRVLCLKDPVAYFHLKPTEKLVFAFMNIKLALAEEIGIAKFQNTIQSSPWFMAHGELEGRTKKVWVPQKYNGQIAIDIKIGSQSDDLIGLPVYCLDGDTIILTNQGEIALKNALGKKLKVLSRSDNGEFIYSDDCEVKPTIKTADEYQIELEDGSIIKCTPNHRFLLTSGEYKEAQNLNVTDEIMDFIPYGYIYKTTNLINNKIYIGQKKSNTFLGENYLGSGDNIRKAIRKYGKENFKVELLEYCENKISLDLKEKEYIMKFDSKNCQIGYNIADGGQGGDLGDTSRKHISEKLKGIAKSEEHKQKISSTLKAKNHHLTEEQKRKISEVNKGKIVSEETRLKHSLANKRRSKDFYYKNTNKGKIVITDGISIRYIYKNETIPLGWYKGNCKTSGKHNMSNYTEEMRNHRRAMSKGSNNNMYGKGYKISGGLNGKANIRYFLDDKVFDCRKDLITYYRNTYGYVAENTIRSIINNTYKNRTSKNYSYLISNLTWEVKKNEN